MHWWFKKYFEQIGAAYGDLLEVSWKIEKLKYLFEAKLKIRPISPTIRPTQVSNNRVKFIPAPTSVKAAGPNGRRRRSDLCSTVFRQMAHEQKEGILA
ncbi:hypothetical protein L3X38_018439 [Prunus dulcis]|uniref:Uncharacterized protein n=1 Tax=Prunus dulcis TaxID=3755 RepID=A0AAD4WBR4_PRUDU|nr:hypothetical protein L3X38_018439 [Prunus dulcis]